MKVVDSQVHIWAANTPERPWAVNARNPHRPVPFTAADLLLEMGTAGVDAAVIVPPTWEGHRNDVGLEAARVHPERFGVMGRFDVDAPGARESLRRWLRRPGMLGIRFHLALEEFLPPFTEGRMDWVWPEAEKAGIPLMMLVMPSLLPEIGRIAERHPALRFTLDHLGTHLGRKDAEAFAELDGLLALAKLPNLSVKASALPIYTTDDYPYRKLHAYLRRVYDAFGPKRMFWGTDFTRQKCSYRQLVTMFTEEIPWLTAQDLEWIMGRSLCEWMRWRLL